MLAEMFNSLPVLPLAAILLLAGGVAMAWPLVAGAGGRSEVKRRLRVELHKLPRQADLIGLVDQGLAPLGLFDLFGAGEQAVQIAVVHRLVRAQP